MKKKNGDFARGVVGDDTCESDRYCLMHLMEGFEVRPEKTEMQKFMAKQNQVIWAEEERGQSWMDS